MTDEGFILRARANEAGVVELLAPSVGIFIPSLVEGALAGPGMSVGAIDVLGVQRDLIVPDGVAGRVTGRCGGSLARVPIQYGDVLVTLSAATVSDASIPADASQAEGAGALSFDAPMSGRFYSRPTPTEPAFVEAGGVVTWGQTVGLLEVMKTFNRLVYQGEGLPERATIEQIVPSDGDDVVRGNPILLLAVIEG